MHRIHHVYHLHNVSRVMSISHFTVNTTKTTRKHHDLFLHEPFTNLCTRMAQRLKFLSENRGNEKQEIENWDADFDDAGELNFTSSVSSAGSSRLAAPQSSGEPLRGERLLRSFSEDINDDLDFEDYHLTTKMSKLSAHHVVNLDEISDEATTRVPHDGKLRKRPSKMTIKVARKAEICIPSDVPDSALVGGTIKRLGAKKPAKPSTVFDYSDDLVKNDDDIDAFTIKASSRHEDDDVHENSLISGALYVPLSDNNPHNDHRHKKKTHHQIPPSQIRFADMEDDMEDGFDFHQEPLTLRKKPGRQVFVDDLDSIADESLGFRASSRLSQNSSYSETTTSESESEIDRDFATGFAEVPESVDGFKRKLEQQKRRAQENAKKDMEILTLRRGPDLIGSPNKQKILRYDSEPPEFHDNEFLDGIDFGDTEADFLGAKETIHRNVVVKNTVRFAEPGQRLERPGVSMQFVSERTVAPSKSSVSLRKVSAKHSTTQLDGLRSKMSMPALRQEKRTGKLEKPDLVSRRTPSLAPSSSTPQIHRMVGEETSPTKRHSNQSHPRLRPAQSMLNLKPSSSSNTLQQQHLSHAPHMREARPKYSKGKTTGRYFGDGSELETLDELPVNPNMERTYTATPRIRAAVSTNLNTKALDAYKEKAEKVARHRTTPARANTSGKRRKRIYTKGPGLIRQLGPTAATTVEGVDGEMHFNPTKLIWEGNDIELKKFDSITPKTPGLIAFISNKGVQVVGDMVFDPEKLCWINVAEDQESTDPFEGLEDLDVSPSSNSSILSIARSTSTIGEFTVGNEFNLTERFLHDIQHEEERWHRKVKGWFSPSETFDRGYLYEIRHMIMKRT